MNIAIIGTGNLGRSIAQGLASNGKITSLYLTRRNINALQGFKDNPNTVITADNVLAVQHSEVIILAIQPAHAKNVFKEIKPHIDDNHTIISTITGLSLADIETELGKDTPIIRAMPNTAISVGESMTCLCANSNGKQKMSIAKSIFNSLGDSLEINENLMQAATVVCASGIAFWMRLIRASTQAAIQLGFEAKEAQHLAMHTCYGAASLLIKNGDHPEQEIDKVTTPRGCTIEGLNEMEHQGLSSSLIHGMVASFNKINAIKEKQL